MRLHVKLGDRETTASLEAPLCVLVALKLGEIPHTKQGKQAVKTRAQQILGD